MDIKVLKREIDNLRSRTERFISVSNSEWYSLFKEEIRNSIAIEGVFANREDLIEVLERNKRTDKQKAASILSYFEAASAMYEYANNQFRENEFTLRMADIKQIHTLLMRYEKDMGIYIGQIGEFRKSTAQVTQSQFTPVNHFYIRPAMELLIEWCNYQLKKKDINPIFLAASVHAWFETIHPFLDGTGRAGRILLSYILIGTGLINIAIKGISKRDRDRYYNSLESCDDCFERMHRLIEEGNNVSIQEAEQQIEAKKFEQLEKIVIERLNEAIERLSIASSLRINSEAVVPLRDLARLYSYSQDYLRNLINRGQLKAHKKGKLWYVRVRDMADYLGRIEGVTE
jgi:Fic family protein